jgi:5-methylcytosine-specific restriction protein A
MPHAARHPCKGANCPELVERGKAYCPKCEKKYGGEYDRQRGTAAARGYDYRWKKIRERKLDTDPMCEMKLPGCTRVAYDVHHRDGDSHNHAWNNLESGCRSCHNKITARKRS